MQDKVASRGGSALTAELGLLPDQEWQAEVMTLAGPGHADDERGHWYSPAAVRKMLDSERKRHAKLLSVSRAALLLAGGEMTASEMRAVRAVLAWMQTRICEPNVGVKAAAVGSRALNEELGVWSINKEK